MIAFRKQMREPLKGLPATLNIVNLSVKIGRLQLLGAESVHVGAGAADI